MFHGYVQTCMHVYVRDTQDAACNVYMQDAACDVNMQCTSKVCTIYAKCACMQTCMFVSAKLIQRPSRKLSAATACGKHCGGDHCKLRSLRQRPLRRRMRGSRLEEAA